MSQQRALNYYDSLIKKLVNDYDGAARLYGSEFVHELRVDIKRLRAFHNLLTELINDYDQRAVVEKARRLFKRAGKLRHYQVQLETLREAISSQGLRLDWYYNLLKVQELRARHRFANFCDDFSVASFRRSVRDVQKAIERSNFIESGRALQRCYDRLAKLRNTGAHEPSTEADLHQVRILAKETRYAFEVVRSCADKSPELESIDQQLQGLHKPLGAWHDLDLALLEFEAAVAAEPTYAAASEESTARFSASLRTERELQLELFRSRWIDFQSPVRLKQPALDTDLLSD